MNRLEAYLKERLEKKGYLFVPYLALGDPDWKLSLKLIEALIEAGADTIELGLPFTDPVADGPVLQRSFKRALQKEFSWDKFFALLKEANKKWPDFQFLTMGYANMFYRYGLKSLIAKLEEHNVGGIITPDIPYEEKEKLIRDEKIEGVEKKIAWINFITPTVTPERLKKICRDSSGFIYFVSSRGVTGIQSAFSLKPLAKTIARVKKEAGIPVLIGFGVRDKSHAKEAIGVADGFIIGSRIHEIIEENIKAPAKIAPLLQKEIAAILP